MSYETIETSLDSGAPMELFRFARGSQVWGYTSADEEYTYEGTTYVPAAITRGNLASTEELGKTELTVTVPRDLDVASQYVADAPDGVMTIAIMRRHRSDSDIRTIWRGRVLGVSFTGVTAELVTESIIQALRRSGLRARYQVTCRHVLYDGGCRLTASDWGETITLDGASGRQLTASGFGARPDGYWTAGYVDLLGVQRLVTAHVGDTVTLQSALPDAAAGAEVEAFPGCDHTIDTCQSKFDNADNFGGFPYIPDRSPFDGSSIV